MERKSVESMNLLDDFLFGKMVSYPEVGEKFSRKLLKIIVGKNLEKILVIPQKVYYGSDNEKHGTRLDVYLEEDVSATIVPSEDIGVYDIEVDKNSHPKKIKALPWRVRFYHAKIDASSLRAGESYRKLKNVFVIMIMPYDPFGLGRMIYTIRNKCEECPDMEYDDGARTLFLYTKGTEGIPSKELQDLLYYMEHTSKKNAVNEDLHEIQKLVDVVKTDEEVALEYMKIFEREEMLIEQGIEMERANTEKEREKAEKEREKAARERMRADALQKELDELRKQKQK